MFSNLGLSKSRKHVPGSNKPQTTTNSTFATQAAMAMFNKSATDHNEGPGVRRSDLMAYHNINNSQPVVREPRINSTENSWINSNQKEKSPRDSSMNLTDHKEFKVPSFILDNQGSKSQEHIQAQFSDKTPHSSAKPVLAKTKRNSDLGNYSLALSAHSPKLESKQPKYFKRHSAYDVSTKKPYLDHDSDSKNISTPSVNGLIHSNPSNSNINLIPPTSTTSASLTALMAATAATKKSASPSLTDNVDRNLSASSFFSQPPMVSNERSAYKHPESPSARSLYSSSSNVQYSPGSGLASRSHSADRSRYNSTESLVSQHLADPNDNYDFLKKHNSGSRKNSSTASLGKLNYNSETSRSMDGNHSNPLKLEMNSNASPRKPITNLDSSQSSKKLHSKSSTPHPGLSLHDSFADFDGGSFPDSDTTPIQESYSENHVKPRDRATPTNVEDHIEFIESDGSDSRDGPVDTLPQYPLALQDSVVNKKKAMRKHGKNVLKGLKPPSGKSHEIKYYPIGLDEANISQIPVVTTQRPVEFRKTMRKEKHKGFNEDKPWKHHNDAMVVTEVEKKRYDGVWVANKGLYMNSVPKFHIDIEKTKSTGNKDVINGSSAKCEGPGINYGVTSDNCNGVDIFPYSHGLPNNNTTTTFSQDLDHPSQMVHAFVVSNIWRRSKLSSITLSKIWNLVDSRKEGYLTRDEFVIGMWLVDQCLYGRKLPNELDATLWESVKKLVVQVVIKPKKNKLL